MRFINFSSGSAKLTVSSFVCLSVRHAFERHTLCARFRHEGVAVQKRFRYRWIGKVCICAPVLNFLRLMPIGDITKCRSPKNGKNWGFSQPQDDINRSRRSFTGKDIPCVCYSMPNLALIDKRGLVPEPPKCQNLPKIVVFGKLKPTQ